MVVYVPGIQAYTNDITDQSSASQTHSISCCKSTLK